MGRMNEEFTVSSVQFSAGVTSVNGGQSWAARSFGFNSDLIRVWGFGRYRKPMEGIGRLGKFWMEDGTMKCKYAKGVMENGNLTVDNGR